MLVKVDDVQGQEGAELAESLGGNTKNKRSAISLYQVAIAGICQAVVARGRGVQMPVQRDEACGGGPVSFGDGLAETLRKCMSGRKTSTRCFQASQEMDEQSPRNTSHSRALGVTNMEKLGRDRRALSQLSQALFTPESLLRPAVLKSSLLSACHTHVKQSRIPGQLLEY